MRPSFVHPASIWSWRGIVHFSQKKKIEFLEISGERSLETHSGWKERCSPATQGVLFSGNPNGNMCFCGFFFFFFFILFGYVGERELLWGLWCFGVWFSQGVIVVQISFKLHWVHFLFLFFFSVFIRSLGFWWYSCSFCDEFCEWLFEVLKICKILVKRA